MHNRRVPYGKVGCTAEKDAIAIRDWNVMACMSSSIRRVALVTGANQGIGLEIVRQLNSLTEQCFLLVSRTLLQRHCMAWINH